MFSVFFCSGCSLVSDRCQRIVTFRRARVGIRGNHSPVGRQHDDNHWQISYYHLLWERLFGIIFKMYSLTHNIPELWITQCVITQVLDGTVPFIMVLLYTTRIGWNSQSGWLFSQPSNAFVTLGGARFPEEKLFSQGGGCPIFPWYHRGLCRN